MIRLYKIYVRPLFEYGSIATSTASKTTLKPWERTQSNFVKYILNTTNISHKNLNKYANLPTIKDRNINLLMNWYWNSQLHNPTIQDFIDEYAKDYNKFDKYITPFKLIKTTNNNMINNHDHN